MVSAREQLAQRRNDGRTGRTTGIDLFDRHFPGTVSVPESELWGTSGNHTSHSGNTTSRTPAERAQRKATADRQLEAVRAGGSKVNADGSAYFVAFGGPQHGVQFRVYSPFEDVVFGSGVVYRPVETNGHIKYMYQGTNSG